MSKHQANIKAIYVCRLPKVTCDASAGCVDDAHIAALQGLGQVQVYGPLSEPEVVAHLKDVNILIGNPYVAPMTANVFARSTSLKLVVLTITGFDRVDMDAANRAGVQVVNSPDYSTEAVAEQTLR
jgi:lactate dehydrogenase-like 2-hydroxyacid dehydrogenase